MSYYSTRGPTTKIMVAPNCLSGGTGDRKEQMNTRKKRAEQGRTRRARNREEGGDGEEERESTKVDKNVLRQEA